MIKYNKRYCILPIYCTLQCRVENILGLKASDGKKFEIPPPQSHGPHSVTGVSSVRGL
jgi:hypothetical protein